VTTDKHSYKAIDSKFEALNSQIGVIHRDIGKIEMQVNSLEEAREAHKMELVDAILTAKHGLDKHDGTIGSITMTLNAIANDVKDLTKANVITDNKISSISAMANDVKDLTKANVITNNKISSIFGGIKILLSAMGLALILVVIKNFLSL
jgi:chromosome segregation ATPase